MNRNEAQTAERNSTGNIRLRRILTDCVLFLIPLLLLPFFLRYVIFGKNPEECRAMSPVSIQHWTVQDAFSAVLPLPDYLNGISRIPDPRLYDDRPRFYPGRPEPPAALNLEPSIFLPVRISICVKDRILMNCRKILKYSQHVRAGPLSFPVFQEFNQVQV